MVFRVGIEIFVKGFDRTLNGSAYNLGVMVFDGFDVYVRQDFQKI